MTFHIKNLTVKIKQKTLLEEINLSIDEGKIACVFGPSGSGKSTLLNTIIGFHKEYSGEIYLQSRSMCSMRPAKDFKIGYVFQDVALFPHLSVEDNIAYAIRTKDREKKRSLIEKYLEMVELPGFENKYPHQLSGGQQQRIGIARSLAIEPDILLLDEPFSNIDAECTSCIISDMRQLVLAQKIPSLLVTHNLLEAEQFADVTYSISDHRLHKFVMPLPLNEMSPNVMNVSTMNPMEERIGVTG